MELDKYTAKVRESLHSPIELADKNGPKELAILGVDNLDLFAR